MKNIALIKSIIAASISSANPALMDVARDMWAGVIKKGL